jgi:hypothetical protein
MKRWKRAVFGITLAVSLVNLGWAQTPLDSQLIVQGLSRPVDIKAPRHDQERLFVAEKDSGEIRIIKNGVLVPTPFLDLSGKIDNSGNGGLLSLAFHRRYRNNGYFYVNYTRTPDTALVTERYTVSAGDPDVANPSSGLTLTLPIPTGFHAAGCIQMGPNGYLYVAIGDGGGCSAQAFGAGKIFRLAVDNDVFDPFIGQTTPPRFNPPIEIHIGLRNPWRFSFDRKTGDMYIGDVGEADREEISFHPANTPGLINHGWPMMEGGICGPLTCSGAPGCGDAALTVPIHDYPHGSNGFCVIGGYVYRGKAIPDLRGTYFFGDHQGKIKSFRYTGGSVTELSDRNQELGPVGNLTTFGEDADGELYFTGLNGKLYKIVPDVP